MSCKVAPEDPDCSSADAGRLCSGRAIVDATNVKKPETNGRATENDNGSWSGESNGSKDALGPATGNKPSRSASFSVLQSHMKSRRSSQMLVEIITGNSNEADDTALMGLKPPNMLSRTKSKARHDVSDMTKTQLAMKVLRRYPAYFAYENAYAMVLLERSSPIVC